MDPSSQQGESVEYQSPRRVQVWFLSRSRRRWKQKYQALKREAKRLRNRVADVTKSREKWRGGGGRGWRQGRPRGGGVGTAKGQPRGGAEGEKEAAPPRRARGR